MAVEVIDAYTQPQQTTWTSSTSANSTTAYSTAGYDTAIVTLSPTNITAGQVVFELYDGYNWISVKAARTDSYSTDSYFNISSISSPHSWQIPAAGYPQFRVRLSTALSGSGSLIVTTIVSSAPDTSIVTAGLDMDSRATYWYAIGDVTPAATPTDIVVIQGSSTKTVRIKRISFWGESTVAGSIGLNVVRKSALGTGTLTSITAGKADVNDVAASASVGYYAANPTGGGTLVGGAIRSGMLTFGSSGTTPQNNLVYDFATRNDKALFLRGSSDYIVVTGTSASETVPTGGKLYIEIETEEDSL